MYWATTVSGRPMRSAAEKICLGHEVGFGSLNAISLCLFFFSFLFFLNLIGLGQIDPVLRIFNLKKPDLTHLL